MRALRRPSSSPSCAYAYFIRPIDQACQRAFSDTRVHRKSYLVADLLLQHQDEADVEVNAWVKSVRKQKRIAFAHVTDASTIHPLQAVLKPEQAAHLSTGAAVRLKGSWQASQGGKQSRDLQVFAIDVLGENDAEKCPLQPKYQTPEFLRTIPHLRPRIPTNALLLRLRSQVIASVTRFFNDEGYVQTHPPVITSSDCEGAGEVFTVSSNGSADGEKVPAKGLDPQPDHFFRSPKYLTVSAQLHLEALAQALGKVWTLSPTFRAERSDTSRHLSEFYMLEAEVCFVDEMASIMDLVENMLRAVATDLQSSRIGRELRDGEFRLVHDDSVVDQDVLIRRWAGMAEAEWPRITYHEAVERLQSAVSSKSATFEFAPTVEGGFQAEHERYLAESVGKGKPVFVTDYPMGQKPFYMPPSTTTANTKGRADTAACFDLLVPDLCELVGGSMREHRSQELLDAMHAKGVVGNNLDWYQDLRKYGSAPHGGFGLGFDRLLCYLGGVSSVRDVVAFPRWHGRCDC